MGLRRSPPRLSGTGSPTWALARGRSTSSILRLSELGEFGLLAELERRGLVRGQDAEGAVLGDGVVVTQDTLVEGVHFRRCWTSWRDLGYKAVAVNLSDLAAMGAEPEALLVALALPAEHRASGRRGALRGPERARRVRWPGATPRAPRSWVSPSPPSGGASACRAGRAPAPATCLSSPVRSAARPPVSTPCARASRASTSWSNATAGRRSGSRRVGGSPRSPTPWSTSPTGSRATRLASPSALAAGSCSSRNASLGRLVVDEVADLPFWTLGEDYELLAAVDARGRGRRSDSRRRPLRGGLGRRARGARRLGLVQERLTKRSGVPPSTPRPPRREPALPRGLVVAARAGADDDLACLAAFEEDHRRDREDVVARLRGRVLVDVQLHEPDALVLVGHVREDRADDTARAAPGRPEVDDHRALRLEDLVLEIGVSDLGELGHAATIASAQRRPLAAAMRSAGTRTIASSTIPGPIFEPPWVRSREADRNLLHGEARAECAVDGLDLEGVAA